MYKCYFNIILANRDYAASLYLDTVDSYSHQTGLHQRSMHSSLIILAEFVMKKFHNSLKKLTKVIFTPCLGELFRLK